VSRQYKSKWQVCGVFDADSDCNEWVLNGTAVIAHLKNRAGDGEIKTIVPGPGQV
jgi:hypothetical protein